MKLDELHGKYRLLRCELDAAYSAPFWDSNQINRITEEMMPLEYAIASCQHSGAAGEGAGPV